MRLHEPELHLDPFRFAQLLVTMGEMKVSPSSKIIIDRLVAIFLNDKAVLQKHENWESIGLYYLLIGLEVAQITNPIFSGMVPISSGCRSRGELGREGDAEFH